MCVLLSVIDSSDSPVGAISAELLAYIMVTEPLTHLLFQAVMGLESMQLRCEHVLQ